MKLKSKMDKRFYRVDLRTWKTLLRSSCQSIAGSFKHQPHELRLLEFHGALKIANASPPPHFQALL